MHLIWNARFLTCQPPSAVTVSLANGVCQPSLNLLSCWWLLLLDTKKAPHSLLLRRNSMQSYIQEGLPVTWE